MIDDQLISLASASARLVSCLPASVVESVAGAMPSGNPAEWLDARDRALSRIAHPHYRSVVQSFFDNWRQLAPDVSPQAVSAALRAASACDQVHKRNQSVELVWTGPAVAVDPLRRTEQAILQVIESATQRLTVVSYAVYSIPRVCDALICAADRGVAISIIIEAPDRIEGHKAYSTLTALGQSVAKKCNVYFWPADRRGRDDSGRLGILHVKCAVADGRWLFLSSANLTEYAFTINMELGLLVTGGSLPESVQRHFDGLILAGVLAPV